MAESTFDIGQTPMQDRYKTSYLRADGNICFYVGVSRHRKQHLFECLEGDQFSTHPNEHPGRLVISEFMRPEGGVYLDAESNCWNLKYNKSEVLGDMWDGQCDGFPILHFDPLGNAPCRGPKGNLQLTMYLGNITPRVDMRFGVFLDGQEKVRYINTREGRAWFDKNYPNQKWYYGGYYLATSHATKHDLVKYLGQARIMSDKQAEEYDRYCKAIELRNTPKTN